MNQDQMKPLNRFFVFIYYLVGLIADILHPVTVEGLEHLPKSGALLCPNHSSNWDPILVALKLPVNYRLHIMAKEELFRNPVLGWILRKVGAFPVNRGGSDIQSVKTALQAIKSGDNLLMFPEGTRCNGDKHVRTKTGAVRIAAAAGAPVVPIFVTRNKTPFCPIDVIVGRPREVACTADAPHERMQEEADEILRTIYKMGGDSYADHIGENSGVLLRG